MGNGPKLLDDLLAPLGLGRFVSDVWTKSHCLLKGEKGRFTPLLPWEALNDILQWHRPSPGQLKLFQDGRQIDPARFIDNPSAEPRLNSGGLISALSQGASLVMDDVQSLVPAVARLAGALQDAFHAPAIVNLYAGWGRQKGFNLHWDAQEVFILQLSGKKHWQVHAPTHAHPLKDDPDLVPEPSGPPLWAGVLEDGDMLYLPRGYWHLVTPLDEPSLHLNFALEPPDSADFLRWWFPQLLSHPEMRRYLPLSGDKGTRQDYFAGILQAIARDGQGRDRAEEFLREWNAYRRAPPHLRLPLAPIEQKAPIGMATRLRLAQRDGLFIEHQPGERTARFRVAGRQYNVLPQFVPALKRLTGHDSVAVTDMCLGTLDPAHIKALIGLLEALASDGILLKEKPSTS
ncbi:MAG TPA: cupin domain-containing protein [Rhizomicrobium sp.]|nr:cupin domain-containing protein [Rhizomicrobium sp.]